MARYRKKKDKEFDDKLKESRLRFPSGETKKHKQERKSGGKERRVVLASGDERWVAREEA